MLARIISRKLLSLVFTYLCIFTYWNLQSNARKLKFLNRSRFKMFFKDLEILQICSFLLVDKVIRDTVLVGYLSWPWSETFCFEVLWLSKRIRKSNFITEDLNFVFNLGMIAHHLSICKLSIRGKWTGKLIVELNACFNVCQMI